ncbi:MAG: VWA domain-containing protein [Thermonemataceae bacterium]|nr:VWA domain-containing protein [Thermonemataceae bacterium]
MDKSSFIFTQSPLWIFVCLLVGALYAWLLYFKTNEHSLKTRYLLASLRFVVVALIAFFLLAPVLRSVKNDIENPIVVLAIDNSSSMSKYVSKQWLDALDNLKKSLEQKDIEVVVQTLDKTQEGVKKLLFTRNSSDLGSLLKNISSNYENRNLDKIVLISDGIHNQGISPEYIPLNTSIYSVGVGDTIPKKDVALQALFFNKLAYLGNKFPIIAEIRNDGFEEREVVVSLLQEGNVIAQQKSKLRKNNISEVDFLVQAQQKGIQKYTIIVENLEGEWTYKNNNRDAIVEVIDGKEKILLLAAAPHPDIKAFRSIIEKNDNYSFEVVIAGINSPKENRYDLVIAYQVPDISGQANALLEGLQKKGIPILFVLGATTDLQKFSNSNALLNVNGRSGDIDEVFASFNINFNKFSLEAEKLNLLKQMPPLATPYGEYKSKSQNEILLYQTIGRLQTNKPLLSLLMNKQNKTAVLAGEGIWQWRLEEYNFTEKNEVVDELFLKIIQFLSAKEDTRKFRVYTTNTEYQDFETVVFEAEAYNDLFEKIANVKVSLDINSDKGKKYTYEFMITGGTSKFEVNNLPEGVYTYTATANILGKTEKASGQFAVRKVELEALSHTANFDLLRKISQNTQGNFYTIQMLDKLQKDLLSTKKAKVIHSSEESLEIIHFKWLFFAILALLSIEWFFRKYLGAY